MTSVRLMHSASRGAANPWHWTPDTSHGIDKEACVCSQRVDPDVRYGLCALKRVIAPTTLPPGSASRTVGSAQGQSGMNLDSRSPVH